MPSKTIALTLRLISCLPLKRRKSLLTILPIAIITGLTDVLVVGLISRLFTVVVGQQNTPSIPFSDYISTDPLTKAVWLIFIYVCINWLASFLRIILRAYQERIRAGIFIDLSEIVQRKVFNQKYEFFLTDESLDISSKILLNITRVSEKLIRPFLQIISGFFIVTFIFIAILSFAKITAFYLIISLVVGYSIISLIVTPVIKDSAKQRIVMESEINTIMKESIRTITDVHLTSSEKFFQNKFSRAGKKAFPYLWRAETFPEFPRSLIEPFGITLIFSIGLFPLLSNRNPETLLEIVPFLATIAVASLKLTPPLQDLFRGITDLRSGIPDLEETLKIIELKDKRNYKRTSNNNKIIYPPKVSIELKSLEFRYPNSNNLALKNINLNIKVGSRVAFVGKTGSGKTTAAMQLLALINPTSGCLLLDGNNLEKENIWQWQNFCSYVPQSINLLNSDILSNVAYGVNNDDIDLDKVIESLASAQLTNLVETLPEGLETNIGENGIRLSGGQRQRIAIARAFYKDSKFLIFDEATSALDNRTEADLINAVSIKRNQLTVLFIAHRLSTVRECDCIYEFDNGEIKSQGNFEELIEKSKSFREMINATRNPSGIF